jgi:hypothetical protein
VPVAGY